MQNPLDDYAVHCKKVRFWISSDVYAMLILYWRSSAIWVLLADGTRFTKLHNLLYNAYFNQIRMRLTFRPVGLHWRNKKKLFRGVTDGRMRSLSYKCALSWEPYRSLFVAEYVKAIACRNRLVSSASCFLGRFVCPSMQSGYQGFRVFFAYLSVLMPDIYRENPGQMSKFNWTTFPFCF